VNYAEADDSFYRTGAVNVTNPNPSKNETNYKFGAGIKYDINESLGMRAEAERYRINDAVGNRGDIDLFSVGLVYRFGR
jgi:OOP family OmpA-OmpF porin